jgi:hypothetical protein
MNCKLCDSLSYIFAHAKILNEYSIAYYQCTYCGFISTEEPFWIDKAYSQAINRFDIGLVSRNIVNARACKTIIPIFFDPEAKFVDFGGGYGMFVRLMRDYGFDFYRSDKYCQNLFANGFDLEDSACDHFELLTAFEVFEHFLEPTRELDALLELSSNILFKTELIPASNPKPDEWWYYGLDHGQHISFYTIKSLHHLATSKGLSFYTNGYNFHLFTPKKIAPLLFRLLCNRMVSTMLNVFLRRASLVAGDYEALTGMRLI